MVDFEEVGEKKYILEKLEKQVYFESWKKKILFWIQNRLFSSNFQNQIYFLFPIVKSCECYGEKKTAEIDVFFHFLEMCGRYFNTL